MLCFVVPLIEPIYFTSRQVIRNMQNAILSSKDMAKKVAQAMELSRKRAAQTKKQEQEKKEVAGGTLKKKDKAPARGKGSKRGVETLGPVLELLKEF